MSAPRSVTVYDTPSGMGGSFTVSIDRDIDPETVEVRVWYGRAIPQGWERCAIGTATFSPPAAAPSPRNAACRSSSKADSLHQQQSPRGREAPFRLRRAGCWR